MATLKLNQSALAAVFRRIGDQVRRDLDCKKVLQDRLRTWDGSPADKAPMTPAPGAPVVRLTPLPENGVWYSADSQSCELTVLVELAVASLDIADVLNLWDALVAAVRPGNGTFAQDLVALGAATGEIQFTQPAVDPKPDAEPEGLFLATGKFRLTVIRSVNP